MNEQEIRAKRAAIRREIKKRMQQDLEERKKNIKRRIGRENISVEKKRLKYRREVTEEKHRLMLEAKEEFRARKRMLGLSPDQELGREAGEELAEAQRPIVEEDLLVFEEEPDESPEAQHGIQPKEAFIYEDKDDTDIRRQYEAPIGTDDALPPEMISRPIASDAASAAGEGDADVFEANSFFYYTINLLLHPVQTLDEFDDYLASRFGIGKVVLFYLVSILLPMIVFALASDIAFRYLPRGLIGGVIRSGIPAEADFVMFFINTVLRLLIYSFSIAIVNYYATNKANFLTLTIYFAFVEGATRIAIYTLIIVASFGGIAAVAMPQLVGLIGMFILLLFIAFFFWTVALNIIVLMSAYGYDLITAVLLAIGAGIVRDIIIAVASRQLGMWGF